jgi:hypothetical protein
MSAEAPGVPLLAWHRHRCWTRQFKSFSLRRSDVPDKSPDPYTSRNFDWRVTRRHLTSIPTPPPPKGTR